MIHNLGGKWCPMLPFNEEQSEPFELFKLCTVLANAVVT